MVEKDTLITELKKIVDPEIPINIVDLGLIRDVDIADEAVNVKMTLTSPFCPVAGQFQENVRLTLLNVDGVEEATVKLDFDPVWDPSQATEAGKMELMAMGVRIPE